MPLAPQLNQDYRIINSGATPPIIFNAGVFLVKLGWKLGSYDIKLGWQLANYILKLGWLMTNYTIQYNSMNPIFIQITAGDFGMSWGFTCQDAAGAIVNLTSATTLDFQAQLISDSSVIVNGSMAVDIAADGTCHYTVNKTDFVVPGTYSAQIAIYSTTTQLFHFSQITITVIPAV